MGGISIGTRRDTGGFRKWNVFVEAKVRGHIVVDASDVESAYRLAEGYFCEDCIEDMLDFEAIDAEEIKS